MKYIEGFNMLYDVRQFHVPIEMTATNLTRLVGGSHSDTNGSTAYFAKLKHIIAIWDGFSTNVDTCNQKKGPFSVDILKS